MRGVVMAYPGTNALAVFTRIEGPASSSTLEIVPFDERGREIGIGGQPQVSFLPIAPGAAQASSSRMSALTVPFFPRRDATVGLRFYSVSSSGERKAVADFVAPNPARAQYPVWPAAALPATVRENEDEFVLTEFSTGGKRSYGSADRGTVTRARFETARGTTVNAWAAESITARDATGNVLAPGSFNWLAERGAGVEFPGLLDPDETHKLEVKFARRSGFAPEELWEVKDVELPEKGGYTTSSAKLERAGVTVSLAGISAENVAFPGSYSRSSSPLAHLRAAPAPSHDSPLRFSLVKVKDQQGRELLETPHSFRLSDGTGNVGFQFPTGTRRVTLTFAMHRAKVVEFRAKPSRAPDPAAKPLAQGH